MKSDEVSLNFQGVNPTDVGLLSIEKRLRRVHEESPYGSSIKVSFIRSNDVVKGVIKITSAAASFVATFTGEGLRHVSDGLIEQIRQQLRKWKIHRFD